MPICELACEPSQYLSFASDTCLCDRQKTDNPELKASALHMSFSVSKMGHFFPVSHSLHDKSRANVRPLSMTLTVLSQTHAPLCAEAWRAKYLPPSQWCLQCKQSTVYAHTQTQRVQGKPIPSRFVLAHFTTQVQLADKWILPNVSRDTH